MGWLAGTGYDLATGLGSVNAYNLSTKWSNVVFSSTNTTLNLSQTSGIAQGGSVTFSGTVAPGSGSGTPTGDVAFILSQGDFGQTVNVNTGAWNGSGTGAFTTLSGGSYSATVSNLPAGTYQVTARYGGDETYASSLSAPVTVTVGTGNATVTITPEYLNDTTTCLMQAVSSYTYGQFAWIPAAVTATSGQGVPTGTVTFSVDGTPWGTVTLDPQGNGYLAAGTVATTSCLYDYLFAQGPTLTGGTHTIGASYSGDSTFSPATATPVVITVNPIGETGTVTTSSLYITLGAPVELTATFTTTALTGTSTQQSGPTGTVTFTDSTTNTVLGTATVNPTISFSGNTYTFGSYAALSTTGIVTTGAHSINATYSGDSNFLSASTSSPLTITVGTLIATTTVVTSNGNPTTLNGRPTLTATIGAASGTAPTSGTVSFYDNYTGTPVLLGQGTVGSGHTATYRPASGAAFWGGVHPITAIFSGTATNTGSTSAVFTQNVTLGTTTIVLDAKTVGGVGQNFTFAAVITPSNTNATYAPNQSVVGFYDSSTLIGTAKPTIVTSAQGGYGLWTATLTVNNLAPGTHTITAKYSDINYSLSTSNALTVTVQSPFESIGWIPPAAITYPAPLTSTQLDASDSVAGTFIYKPAAGTILLPGAQTLSVTFIPTDTAHYAPQNTTVQLQVNMGTQTVTISPAAGTYNTPQTVTISDSVSGAVIYYTTNGSTPMTSSAVYTSPITVTGAETVKAMATAGIYYLPSAVTTTSYTIQALTPTFNPAAGTYTTIQSVSISDATTGAVIYYTTNGSTPTTGSSVYSGAITVSATQTIEAIATASGYTASTVGSAAYTINLPTAATPTFNPVAGSYGTAQSVTISDATTNATIYYTTNGNTPTTGSAVYSAPISVTANETIEAMAVAYNYLNSAAGSAAYTIAAATPAFSPVAGSYSSAQSVSISDNTAGAVIYYTTNGSTPTTGSPVYSVPIIVSGAVTVKAMAAASGYGVSATGSAAYVTPVITPAFSLAAGSYVGTQTVTISDATPNAVIYYTTNATTPTSNSTAYTGTLSISATTTVEAIGVEAGAPSSSAAVAIYTILGPATLTSPAPGSTLGSSQTFSWTPGNGDVHYELWLGSTGVGSSNLYNSGNVTVTSENVTGLPTNGQPVYARLYTLLNGNWVSNDYTYTASGSPTLASMSSPDQGSTLSGASQAFTWNSGNLATHFELWVGTTGVGSSNLYNSGNVTVTTETVNGIPTNGQPVYVRLYSLINGSWESNDYSYTASGSPIAASMSTPTPGTTLGSTSQAFTWLPGNIATHFELWVGSTAVGSSNLYNSGNVTVTTETVNGLPDNASTVYVRLYSLINGTWQSVDYTYTSAGVQTPAFMISPAGGSTLGSTSQAFTWSPGNTATHFELWVGSIAVGSSNLYNSGNVTVTTETVNGLPANGQPLYVRLYSLISGTWQSVDYTYTASGSPTPAVLTTPTPGTQFMSSSETFVWTTGNTATHFELWLGSTGVGSSNLYNSGNVTVTTENATGLPTNAETIYARLYWLINGSWQSADYTYTSQ
jgi:hypothetical protein